MTNHWTTENTEGFTQTELDTINAVRATMLQGFTGDPKSIDDAINNAWHTGISYERLARKAYDHLLA